MDLKYIPNIKFSFSTSSFQIHKIPKSPLQPVDVALKLQNLKTPKIRNLAEPNKNIINKQKMFHRNIVTLFHLLTATMDSLL